MNLTAVDETSGAGALEMRISNYGNFTSDGSTSLPWVTYAAQTLGHPLLDTSLDGLKRVYAQVRTLDQTAPTGVSFSLDDPEDSDDNYAEVQAVTGIAAATGAAQVCLDGQLTNGSSDGCSSDGWVAYTTSLAVNLTATSGNKPVALFARDAAGNVASPAVDSIYLDTIAPSATEIVSLSPRTTSVFLDLSAATDDESGVDGYEVDYQIVGDSTWTTVSFSTDQGTVSGLAAPRVCRFQARAVDRAGNLGSNSVAVDRLVGLSASMVEGFDNIAAFGDRVYSARGHVFFPRMIDEETLVMLSCDARSEHRRYQHRLPLPGGHRPARSAVAGAAEHEPALRAAARTLMYEAMRRAAHATSATRVGTRRADTLGQPENARSRP